MELLQQSYIDEEEEEYEEEQQNEKISPILMKMKWVFDRIQQNCIDNIPKTEGQEIKTINWKLKNHQNPARVPADAGSE